MGLLFFSSLIFFLAGFNRWIGIKNKNEKNIMRLKVRMKKKVKKLKVKANKKKVKRTKNK